MKLINNFTNKFDRFKSEYVCGAAISTGLLIFQT